MRPFVCVAVLAFSLCLVPAPASAGVLFDNFPISGQINAWNISDYVVSDSFSLAGESTVTQVNFGYWAFYSDSMLSLDWTISTGLTGGVVATGTASTSSGYFGLSPFANPNDPNGLPYYVYSADFSVPNVTLAGGTTYYLTLQGATAELGQPLFWDENDLGAPTVAGYLDGAPIAQFDGQLGVTCDGSDLGTAPCSESFQIVGNSTTPEPGTTFLFGSGLLLVAGGIRRKTQR